jgi:hypothetical protein
MTDAAPARQKGTRRRYAWHLLYDAYFTIALSISTKLCAKHLISHTHTHTQAHTHTQSFFFSSKTLFVFFSFALLQVSLFLGRITSGHFLLHCFQVAYFRAALQEGHSPLHCCQLEYFRATWLKSWTVKLGKYCTLAWSVPGVEARGG